MRAEIPTATGMPIKGVFAFTVEIPKTFTVTQIENPAQAKKIICLIGSTISHGIMSLGLFLITEEYNCW